MNEKKALTIIEEKMIGKNSIPVKIRVGEGIKEEDYSELIEAINFLIIFYKTQSSVPKVLALCFLDISNYFFLGESNYSEIEIEKIEDLGIELVELANLLFSN